MRLSSLTKSPAGCLASGRTLPREEEGGGGANPDIDQFHPERRRGEERRGEERRGEERKGKERREES